MALLVWIVMGNAEGLSSDARWVATIAPLMAVWWMMEAIPLSATARLPIMLIPMPETINIPLAQLEDMLDKLPQDREIVAYCRGPYCILSHEAVQRLRQLGYRVRRFEEGYPEWKAAGLPVA